MVLSTLRGIRRPRVEGRGPVAEPAPFIVHRKAKGIAMRSTERAGATAPVTQPSIARAIAREAAPDAQRFGREVATLIAGVLLSFALTPTPARADEISDLRDMVRQLEARIKALGLNGKGKVRINQAGCLDRCDEGPVLVIYPDAVWYTYVDRADIDEIIARPVLKGEIVERLRV